MSPLHVSCVLLEIPSLWACISGRINVAGFVGVTISTVMAQIDTTTPAPHVILATDVVHGAITATAAASSVVASWAAFRVKLPKATAAVRVRKFIMNRSDARSALERNLPLSAPLRGYK